jgi:hypothetical protein
LEQAKDWRILAKQVVEERDPEKLLEIVEALSRAIDEQEGLRHGLGQKRAA